VRKRLKIALHLVCWVMVLILKEFDVVVAVVVAVVLS